MCPMQEHGTNNCDLIMWVSSHSPSSSNPLFCNRFTRNEGIVDEFSVNCRVVLESGEIPYLLDAGYEAKGRESLHLKLCRCFESGVLYLI